MDDKAMELKFNGEPFISHRNNTVLFTHFGRFAMYDHVYMLTQQGENGVLGGYIWSDHSVYEALSDFIKTHNFPQVLNANEVSQGDKKAFEKAHPDGLYVPTHQLELPKGSYSDLEDLYFTDSFPEDWENGV